MAKKKRLDIEEAGLVLQPSEKLVAVSRIFARARKNLSLAEQKTLVLALSQIRFKEEAKSNIVYLDKKMLANILGINSDTDHLSINLHRAIKELPKHSFIEIADKDLGIYDSGCFITRVTMLKNRVRIKFEDEYITLFTGLSTDYITMWSEDIFGMKTSRSVTFYEMLRQMTDTRKTINSVTLGVKALKEMFGIPKEKYIYAKNGAFNRVAFEKKVIYPICDDLQNTKMIKIIVQQDGKPYEKVKQGGRVLGYKFYWIYSQHPTVADAAEVKEIQDRVDKNPEVLKVAKDIIKSEKRTEKKHTVNSKAHDFNERQYDIAAIERLLQQKTY